MIPLPAHLRDEARALALELQHTRLEVALKPARSGPGMVRYTTSTNPDWYRRLCACHSSKAHPRRQRHDTSIKRMHVLHALRCAALGQPFTYHRAELIQLIADSYATHRQEIHA